jgi:hypothetical protein|tara:strand:- start:249 stop:458 length:210 start_codon:yes stop_codon:yes gene_type:complete
MGCNPPNARPKLLQRGFDNGAAEQSGLLIDAEKNATAATARLAEDASFGLPEKLFARSRPPSSSACALS